MTIFVFVADGWGAVSGGINCFNYDLATACAHIKKSNQDIRICCAIPDLNSEQKAEMRKEGIIPITISNGAFHSPEAAQVISDKMKAERELRRCYPERCNTFCVGHDVYTGGLSRQLAEICDGWNIVFHHMDYSSYYLFGKHNVPSYKEKVKRQKTILGHADLVCAVGPMLLQSAEDMVRETNTRTIEVFPGLAAFDKLETPPNRFAPIVFGRIEKNNQAIKQIPLAIDAFAAAIAGDKDTPIINNNPTLRVVGYEADDQEELTREVECLQERVFKIAGRMCNVVPYPYTHDRAELGGLLRSASAAMMLSLHEGFGLVGYEAIAAGIPLILSKNTGLYMFLEREHLEHLVYAVQINGSSSGEKYSDDDLHTVARALRDIRQKEKGYKENALNLRKTLLSRKDKYSWDAVAASFIDSVLQEFEDELKIDSTVFYIPDKVIKLSADLKAGTYTEITFKPSPNKRVYAVTGRNSLASLVNSLQKEFEANYDIFVYNMNMQTGEDESSACSDFLNNCQTVFGEEGDPDIPGFKYILGKRLHKTILILDDFPIKPAPSFEDLFFYLNRLNNDFYIFAVNHSDSQLKIVPFHKNSLEAQSPTVVQKPVSLHLTAEQQLLAKVLAFRGKRGYSKRLISYICIGMNAYQDKIGGPPVFEHPTDMERELKELNLIEEYSEYSYQNVNQYLAAAAGLELNDKLYALGLSRLGLFYARCYHRGKGRDQQPDWGYFSCKCFADAAGLDSEIRNEIKADYEKLLNRMRKRAMDTSDYSRYLGALQKFIDEYKDPNDPWMWYTIIHCETLCCPNADTLHRLNHVLQTEFPDDSKENRSGNALYVQLIRLVAELEYELDIDSSLEHLINQIKAFSQDLLSTTAWNQCLSTVVSLAIEYENFDLAGEYLERYKTSSGTDNPYPKVIAIAMETNLSLAKYAAGHEVNLTTVLPNIRDAYRMAENILKDYRAQGWTVGLWGECQTLLNNAYGEGNLRKSMHFRKNSGEKTKTYRNWLRRISKYSLQPFTKKLLKEELDRVGIQTHVGV